MIQDLNLRTRKVVHNSLLINLLNPVPDSLIRTFHPYRKKKFLFKFQIINFPHVGSVVSPDRPGECLAVKQCAKNDDCPGNAFCSTEKVCNCPEPNQGPNCESKLHF